MTAGIGMWRGFPFPENLGNRGFKTIGGIVTRYKKSDIAARAQQKLSIMPAGLEQTMSAGDLVDLVEYLSTLKTGKTASGPAKP